MTALPGWGPGDAACEMDIGDAFGGEIRDLPVSLSQSRSHPHIASTYVS